MDYGSVVKNKTKKSPGKLTLLEKKNSVPYAN